MGFARRTLKFGGGLVLGAAVGTAISVLLAPQSGPELKAELSDRAETARRAGAEAELLEQERLRQLFRTAVNSPLALTGQYDGAKKAEKSEAEKAREQARKEQEEAEKARQAAMKAEEEVRRAQEKARKAGEKAAKEEADAAQARVAAEQQSGQG
jgi:gas vesicle protein